MRLDSLPVGVFDVILLGFLAFGIARGRKHGMSEELLKLIQWLCVVVVCAFAYESAGAFLESCSPFNLLTSYIIVYICCALLVLGLFGLLKHSLGGKLLGSDLFGKSEYYLGMASGAVRLGCVLLVGLALLNARLFSTAEVQAMERYQNDVYGSNFFPGLHSIQSTVFEKSLSGPWIRNHLSLLLIRPTVPTDKTLRQQEYMFPH